jgi:hypothetical protein
MKQLYCPAQTNINGVTNNKNIHPILGNFCAIIIPPPPPHFLDDESGKNFYRIFE